MNNNSIDLFLLLSIAVLLVASCKASKQVRQLEPETVEIK